MKTIEQAIGKLREIEKFAAGNAATNSDDRLTWGAHARACREVIDLLSTPPSAERAP